MVYGVMTDKEGFALKSKALAERTLDEPTLTPKYGQMSSCKTLNKLLALIPPPRTSLQRGLFSRNIYFLENTHH